MPIEKVLEETLGAHPAVAAVQLVQNETHSNLISSRSGLLGLSLHDVQPIAQKSLHSIDPNELMIQIEGSLQSNHAILSSIVAKVFSDPSDGNTIFTKLQKHRESLFSLERTMREKRQQAMDLYLGLDQDMTLLLQDMLKLLKAYKFGKMIERHELMARYYALLLTNMSLKIETVKFQQLWSLYEGPDMNPQTIHDELHRVKNQLETELMDLDRQLYDYQLVGTEFHNITQQYATLCKDVDKTVQDISRLEMQYERA